MMTILLGILVGLLITSLILGLANSMARPKTDPTEIESTQGATTSITQTKIAPITTNKEGGKWLEKIAKFFLGIFMLAVASVVIAALAIGVIKVVQYGNSCITQAQGPSDSELVRIRPGESVIVDLKGKNQWDFDPPQSTMVEQFDANEQLLPVCLNGQWVERYISHPKDNNLIESSMDAVRFLRLTSVNPRVGEYTFVVYKR